MDQELSGAPQQDAELNVVWQPHAGSQVLYLTVPHSILEVLYEGTRGPGKTDALLMSFAKYVGLGFGPYWRGIIFRQTYKQLSDIINKSRRWFHAIFPGARYNKSEHVWTFEGGEELLFRQMRTPNDYWDYHGHEYPFIGWEELTNWITLECYELMKSCCRATYPGDDILMPRMIRATANPFGIGHTPVKHYFIDPAPRGIPVQNDEGDYRVSIFGSVYENTHLLKADPGYVRRLEAIKDPNVRKAWLHGDWNIVAGGACDDLWKEDEHMIQEFEIPPTWEIRRSFDWGSSSPFSVGWWVRSNGEEVQMADGTIRTFAPGTKIRVGELYGCKKDEPNTGLKWTNRRIAREIKEFEESRGWEVEPGGADRSIFDEGHGFEVKSIASEMEDEAGITFIGVPKGPGSRRTRLSILRSALEASLSYPMEAPGIFAVRNCNEFRRQIPILPRDPRDYECVDTDAEDHLYDESTYELMDEHSTGTGFRIQL